MKYTYWIFMAALRPSRQVTRCTLGGEEGGGGAGVINK